MNDILACGARPLFFLDYFAAGRLNPVDAASVLQGFVKACKENKCALVGGETAEMPGLYGENEYDLSGTVVGVVEKRKIVTGAKIRKGDLLIGLHSTGLHTNGYSLARTVLFRKYGVNDYVYDLGDTVGNYLLRVHKSYLNSVWSLMESIQLNGIAHITGGGIVGNTSRILPKGLSIDINWKSWQRPTIFQLIQETGGVPEEDMQRTFNLGVGLIVIVSKRNSEKAQTHLSKMGEHPFIMGEVN